MSALVLAVFLFLTIANYRTFRDLRYPPFILSALWLGVMTVYYLSPITMHPVSLVTASIFVAAVVSFTFGGQLALALENDMEIRTVPGKPLQLHPAHPRVKKMLLLATVCFLPALVYKAGELAELSGIDNLFVGLRVEVLSEDSPGYGVIGNASILSFLTTFLYSVELRKTRWEKLQYFLSVIVSFIYAVLITGRTPFFLIIVVLLGIAAMERRFTGKKLAAGVLAFLLSFGIFGLVLGKGGSLDASWSENSSSMGQSLVIYTVGPLSAFDRLVGQDPMLSYGKNSFAGVLNVFYRLSGHTQISPIPEEVNVPFPINAYTGLRPVYLDFGILGVILAFAFIGAASTYFYVRAAGGDKFYILCYSLSLFPLLYVTFSDQYFAPMLSWAKYVFAGYLYFRVGHDRTRHSV